MNDIADLRRKVYDLEIYYLQVSNHWADTPEKEYKLLEIQSQINDYEADIYDLQIKNVMDITKYMIYLFFFIFIWFIIYLFLKKKIC